MQKKAINECNLFFFDCETGGLDPNIASMIEVACVVTDPTGENVIHEYCAKVKPLKPVHPTAAAINGYTPEVWEKEAVDSVTAMAKLMAYARGAVFIAHNVAFDWAFFEQEMKRLAYRWQGDYHKVDTVALAWPFYSSMRVPNVKLVTLREFFGIETGDAHRALADVHACRQLYLKLMGLYNGAIHHAYSSQA
jgi:DNA polymerase III epsilon subunit-like protein